MTVKRRHTALQMQFCYLSLKNNAEATVHCTLQIESSVLSFYLYLFPCHLKCSRAGQRNSIAGKALKRSFFYMVFFYCGQYWRRLPEEDGNCRQFSVSQLAACCMAVCVHHLQGGPVLCLV